MSSNIISSRRHKVYSNSAGLHLLSVILYNLNRVDVKDDEFTDNYAKILKTTKKKQEATIDDMMVDNELYGT